MLKPEAGIAYGVLVSLIAAFMADHETHWVWVTFACSLGLAVLWYWINVRRSGDTASRWFGTCLYILGMVMVTTLPAETTWMITVLLMALAALGIGLYFCFPDKPEPISSLSPQGSRFIPLQPKSKTENFGKMLGQRIGTILYRSRR